MTIVQAILLGIIQGVGEFLPISSSAHLYLVPWLLGWQDQGLTFDVALHLGTLVAVILVFWRDLWELALAAVREGWRSQSGRLGWALLAGTIPGALAGYLFEDRVALQLRSPVVMAAALAAVGVLLWAVDRAAGGPASTRQVGFWSVVGIGAAQALAIIPGVSRSGITITAGLAAGLGRTAAARISFLLSFPIILGAGALKLSQMNPAEMTPPFWVGIVTSAVIGFLVIRFLLDYLRRGTYVIFAVYRLLLAGLVLLSYLSGFRGA